MKKRIQNLILCKFQFPLLGRGVGVRLFFIFIFTFGLLGLNAQDSSRLRISLLTCTPGDELYSTFGHSAFRVVDSNSVTDIVYNYGTFNFDDEGFYLKFVTGKLLYYVSPEYFSDFKDLHQSTNRGITEQVLNLTEVEKKSIQHFLNENLKEENKYYQYDFLFDNCTTRLRDILKKQHDSSFTQTPSMPEGSSFRFALHQYLDKGYKAWSKLGIDLLLGARCDGKMTAENMQFLPDNLMKSLDSSKVPMLISSQNLYPIDETANQKSLFTPLVVFSLLLAFIFLISLSKNKLAVIFLQGFDGLFFFLIGTMGIILLFMWTSTEHNMVKNNFNLIWAWPTHIFISFFVNSRKNWVKKYFKFTAMALMAVLISWFFLPQQMNNSLLPLVLLMIYRSVKKSLATE